MDEKSETERVKKGTLWSQAEQRAASSAAQKTMAAALSHTSQRVRIIFNSLSLCLPMLSFSLLLLLLLQFLKT